MAPSEGDLMGADPQKILVVDDEHKLVEVIASYLKNSGYAVLEAYDCRQGIAIFEDEDPDLIILDLMLPDMSGEEFCEIIRKKSSVPIIMLTAKVEEQDILKGLGIGADDYVTKPFSVKQLVARVQALLRRCGDGGTMTGARWTFNNNDLKVNLQSHEVLKGERSISLTPNEYSILSALIRFPHKVFTRDELILSAFGHDFSGFDRTVDSHVKNLRQKIEDDSKCPRYVLTVYGVGYKFGGE